MKYLPNDWNLESVVALTYVKGLGYSRHSQIIEQYNSFDEFAQKSSDIKQSIFSYLSNEHLDEAKKQLEFCDNNNISIISIWHEKYPKLLKKISYPPTVLYVKGNLQDSNSISISIVGTRKCTTYGKLATEKFVSEFSKSGIIITSGLAYGIDSAVHKSAIKNAGITYAVVASGLDKIKPYISQQLADEIVESGGAIVSEYKCGTLARPGYFPQRNRIISGISKATLVMESSEKGGSLITAKFAQDQNREVFAVPGTITSEQSAGCNSLIYKNIAAIAISPQMVLMDLGLNGLSFDTPSSAPPKFNSDEEKLVYNAISHEPVHVDAIADATGMEIQDLLVLLLQLEFNELIRQLPGKHYIKG